MKCPDKRCNGELRKHPEVMMSIPPIYTYGCLKCHANYKQRGESGDLEPHWSKEPIDWDELDRFLDKHKKDEDEFCKKTYIKTLEEILHTMQLHSNQPLEYHIKSLRIAIEMAKESER